MPIVPSRAQWRSLGAAALILLALGLFSFAFATHFTFHFEQLRFMDHYRYQANGWGKHHLFLVSDRGQQLACMDCAFFGKHAWLAYGPFPALIQLTLNGLFRLNVSSPAIVWLLAFSTLCIFFWFARRFFLEAQQASARTATGLALSACVFAGTSERFLHSATVGYSWSQAALTSQLCLLLSVACFFLFSTKRTNAWLVASGAFAGAALLGKQNYSLNFLVTALFLIWMLGREKQPVRVIAIACVRFLLPVGLSISILLLWNGVRFGNPFDSGAEYVNASERNPNNFVLPDYHRIPHNFYNHFLSGFAIDRRDLPLLFGLSSNFGPPELPETATTLLHNYPMFSLFLAMPVLVVIPIHLLHRVWQRKPLDTQEFWTIYFIALPAAIFAPYLLLDSSWSRYQYDLIYLWILAGACVLSRLRPTGALMSLLVAALTWQTLVAVDQTLGLLFSRNNHFIHWDSSERGSDRTMSDRLHALLFSGTP